MLMNHAACLASMSLFLAHRGYPGEGLQSKVREQGQQEGFLAMKRAMATLKNEWWNAEKTLEAKMANYLPAATLGDLRDI